MDTIKGAHVQVLFTNCHTAHLAPQEEDEKNQQDEDSVSDSHTWCDLCCPKTSSYGCSITGTRDGLIWEVLSLCKCMCVCTCVCVWSFGAVGMCICISCTSPGHLPPTQNCSSNWQVHIYTISGFSPPSITGLSRIFTVLVKKGGQPETNPTGVLLFHRG